MSIAQHAERILAAWNVADPERFEMELEQAFHSCQKQSTRDMLELEQRELLQSVIERLRQNQKPAEFRKSTAATGLSAGFALLRHLSARSIV